MIVAGLVNKKEVSLKVIRRFFRFSRDLLIIVNKFLLMLIPKRRDMILLTAWFGEKYADNTMYLYEYLLKTGEFRVVWTTRNREVYKKLKKSDMPVVYSNSLKGIWTQIRAKMLISTIQLNDYNRLFLSNCILFDIDHGIIFKKVGYEIDPTNTYIKKHDAIAKKNIEYYMSATSFLTQRMMQHSYHVQSNRIVLSPKPRLDVFFDEKLRVGKNSDVEKLKNGRKAIVYMPTHRKCGEVSLKMDDILDLASIHRICNEYNCVFIIRKHFYHRNENENLTQYNNIFDITNLEVDSQVLEYQADILISDYSSSYIDFLLLDRPIILYTFDFAEYQKHERGLYVPLSILDVGYQPTTKEELNECILSTLNDDEDKYALNRERVKRIYFDESLEVRESRKACVSIIKQLMDGSYRCDWDAIAEREMTDCNVVEIEHHINRMNLRSHDNCKEVFS